MCRRIYGQNDHPSIEQTLNNIGLVYSKKGDYEEALEYYNQSLEMCRRMYDQNDHPSIGKTLNNIDLVKKKLGI